MDLFMENQSQNEAEEQNHGRFIIDEKFLLRSSALCNCISYS